MDFFYDANLAKKRKKRVYSPSRDICAAQPTHRGEQMDESSNLMMKNCAFKLKTSDFHFKCVSVMTSVFTVAPKHTYIETQKHTFPLCCAHL